MAKTAKKYEKSENFMSMMELTDVLGSRIREVLRTDLTPEEREIMNAQNRFIIALSNQHINAANVILTGEKYLAENNDIDKTIIKELIQG